MKELVALEEWEWERERKTPPKTFKISEQHADLVSNRERWTQMN